MAVKLITFKTNQTIIASVVYENDEISDILCITSPMVELENEYNKLFGSGIQIASSIPKF